jgi:SAM-dependent methyltransferase
VSAIRQWRQALAAWQIPADILAGAEESPWVLPRHVFTRRVDRQLARPGGPSYAAAWRALDPPGSVLDVGAGAGAASLPLAGRCTEITAVDTDAELLAELTRRAAGVPHRTVHGAWPEVAGQVRPADVVLCHHVIYNVPDLGPFVAALTGHARRLVVVETAQRHPLTELNELWRRFHGIERPDGPTADDAVAALVELGITPHVEHWHRPRSADHADFDTLVDVTRRRLCLPQARAGEVAAALRDLGHGRGGVPDLGSSGDAVTTLTWPGGA